MEFFIENPTGMRNVFKKKKIENLKVYLAFDQVEELFGGAKFAIDCTTHYRRRVYPGQKNYYRGDKHGHFLTAQVVCDLRGLIFNVAIAAQGHNNDQGLFNMTFREELVKHNIVGLGYTHPNLYTPINKPEGSSLSNERWSSMQSDSRSPVEIVNGKVKKWLLAENKAIVAPEYQTMG